MAEEKKKTEEKEQVFTGKYIKAVGRRKTAIANVRIHAKGKGTIVVNEKPIKKYFAESEVLVVNQPLKTTSHLRDFDISVIVQGGGVKSQSEAVRHGIARALVKFDKELKPILRAKEYLTRDARKKERKKPGLKKARRAPQWSKR